MTYFVADLAVRASMLLGATWLAALALDFAKASAAKRYAVWMSGFIALALLPLGIWLLPRFAMPILPGVMTGSPSMALTSQPAEKGLAITLQVVYLAIG